MNQVEYLALVESTTVALLEAPSTDDRQRIVDEISDDPEFAADILLLLSECIKPLLLDLPKDQGQALVQ